MKHFRVSPDANTDLEEIFTYWAEHANAETADRVIDAIVERFWLLGEYPDCGRACDDIAPGVRCFPAGKYLIYYRKLRRTVEIAHIFHGARSQQTTWAVPRKSSSRR